MSTIPSPILITGPHRSGTTWIGQILGGDSDVGTIHEPFSPTCRPGIFPFPIPFWYYRVPTPAPPRLVDAYVHLLDFRYACGAELRALRSVHDAGHMVRDALRFFVFRMQKRRPVIKDPLALLSAEWVAQTFACAVLVTTRHPLAFVSSVHRLGWRFDFNDLQQQKEAMELIGDGEEDVARGRRASVDDPIAEAAYLWKVLHRVIARYRTEHPDWIFARYEDLARDPLSQFETIFAKLHLRFDERVRRRIQFLSGEGNPTERENDPRVTRVDSLAHAQRSMRRLTPKESDLVRRIVEPVSASFYSDQDW